MKQRFLKTTRTAWRAAGVVTLAGTVFTVPVTRDFKAAPSGHGAEECKFAVVPCNYAHLYSGTISWTESTNASAGSFNATVGVTVTNGVGVCTGSETSVSISRFGRTSRTGTISGKALVAVEFDFYEEASGSSNPANRQMGYKVTAACPSADYPATSDGSAATPATPAELDGRERSSYPQSATAIEQKQLSGTNTSKPEEDTVNGVTSLLVVKWDLKKP